MAKLGPTPVPEHPVREPDLLLATWEERATVALFAYNRAANRAAVWDTRIGAVVATLTAIAGTSVFATLNDDPNTAAKVAVGLVTIAAATFSGIQAFAGLPQRIQHYRDAARSYGAIRRDIEQARLMLSRGGRDTEEELTRLRLALDDVADVSPNAPKSVWERTRRHVKGDFTRWERWRAKVKGLPPPKKLGQARQRPHKDDGA